MSKPSDRKLERRRKKARSQSRKQQISQHRQRVLDRFPRWNIIPGSAPQALVEAVDQTLKTIAANHGELLNDRSFLSPGYAQYLVSAGLDMVAVYRQAALDGFRVAFQQIDRAVNQATDLLEFADEAQSLLTRHIGAVLYGLLSKDTLDRFSPFHFADLRFAKPRSNMFQVEFLSLKQQAAPGGTIYYSRKSPKIDLNGERLIAGFSTHAVKRVCERLVEEPCTYPGAWDCFAFLDRCVHFQEVKVVASELWFTFYQEIESKNSILAKMAEVFAGPLPSGKAYMIRIGYCPAAVEGRFVKGITFLFPGMRDTPERRLVLDSSLPDEKKRMLANELEQTSLPYIRRTGQVGVYKFVHDNGVPQVVVLDRAGG
jgi:hypothetical protein